MNCESVRMQIGAEPASLGTELAGHLEQCPGCRSYREQMLQLDAQIRRALELPLTAVSPVAVAPTSNVREFRRSRPHWVTTRGWALAASVVLAVTLTLVFWSVRPQQALAAAVVAHMAEEPQSWGATRPVSPAMLAYVLRLSGVRLDAAASGEVVYAHSCWFRGRLVPHLVVRTAAGPVTVLVLKGERVRRALTFAEGGYSGMLQPYPGGAVAVLGRGEMDVAEALARVRQVLVLDESPSARTDQPP